MGNQQTLERPPPIVSTGITIPVSNQLKKTIKIQSASNMNLNGMLPAQEGSSQDGSRAAAGSNSDNNSNYDGGPNIPKQSQMEEEPVFETLTQTRKVRKMLKLKHLKSPYLKSIFSNDTQGALDHLESIRCNESRIDYERDLIVAFWYGVHLQRLELSRHLLNQDPYIKQLVALAMFKERLSSPSGQVSGNASYNGDVLPQQQQQQEVIGQQFQRQKSILMVHNKDGGGEGAGRLNQIRKQVTIKIEKLGEGDNSNQRKSYINKSSFDDHLNDRADDQSSFENQAALYSKSKKPSIPAMMVKHNLSEKNYEGGEEEERKGLIESEDEDSVGGSQEDEEIMRRRDHDHLLYLKQQGLSEQDIEDTDFTNITQLQGLRKVFRAKYPQLISNILRILLEKDEEPLACQLAAYYELSLDDDLILYVLERKYFKFLQFIWIFHKNCLGQRFEYLDTNSPEQQTLKHGVDYISFTQLIDLILNVHEESPPDIEQCIRHVCEWLIKSLDSLLLALLYHYKDEFALEFMGQYNSFLNRDLFLYSLNHGNRLFLQHGLLMGAFDKTIFKDEDIINQMLIILRDGSKTNFLLNVLLLIDISLWKNKELKELLQIFEGYVANSYEKNYLLLSSNPLMSIALSAELLRYMASHRKRFENECNQRCQDILNLGKMFLSKVEDEKYFESLMLDRDFKDRPIIKIITENYFESLLHEEDPKGENLLVKLWQGKEASKCDGNIFGYSNLTYVLTTGAKKTSSKSSTTMWNFITNFYEPNYEHDYTFQYRYRSKSIGFFFMKEFIFALGLLFLFQYVNYQYLTLFRGQEEYLQIQNVTQPDGTNLSQVVISVDISNYIYDFGGVNFEFNDQSEGQMMQTFQTSRVQYRKWELYVLILSASLLLQVVLRGVFNMCTKKNKMQVDKWTIMDAFNAILTITSFEVVINVPLWVLVQPFSKYVLDYLIIAVLIISWLRFFIYFLLIEEISKMLLTIYEMLTDTLSFVFIVLCYLLIVASVFTTLYQDINPGKFGGMAPSLKTMYNAAMGVYDYNGMGTLEFQFSVLQIIHIFLSNILLLNFLIAILSFTYDKMQMISIFKYKVNVYQYSERYLAAFTDEEYSEIALHPPPVSLLSALLVVLLVLFRPWAKHINKYFSYLIFWLENLILGLIFFIYEILISPIVYGRILLNLVACNQGLFTVISYVLTWIFFGAILTFIIVLKDIRNLFKILQMHEGCRHAMGLQDELEHTSVEPRLKLKVYNEIRQTVIELYIELRKQALGALGQKNEDFEDYAAEGNFHDIDVLNMLEQTEEQLKRFSDHFIIKFTVVHDEWSKRRSKAIKALSKKKSRINNDGNNESGRVKKGEASLSKRVTGGLKHMIDITGMSGVAKTQIVEEMIFKSKKLQPQILNNDPQAIGNLEEFDEDEDLDDYEEFEIETKLEERLVDDFLRKFIVISEKSTLDYIDIVLMLRALPNQIVDYNLEQNELFNFKVFQDSLIAFQNLDLVNAFEYYDTKNRERSQQVKDMLQTEKAELKQVQSIIGQVKMHIVSHEDQYKGGGRMLPTEINSSQNSPALPESPNWRLNRRQIQSRVQF